MNGVDGTLLVGDALGESFKLNHIENRATLTSAIAHVGSSALRSRQVQKESHHGNPGHP